MKKLMLSLVAVAALSAGTAFADAESQAGSAWRSNPDYGPAPGTAEAYGNSGWPPVQQIQPYGAQPYNYYGNRAYGPQAAPAYPYGAQAVRPNRRDRDGDGVRDSRDRYPNDPSRW